MSTNTSGAVIGVSMVMRRRAPAIVDQMTALAKVAQMLGAVIAEIVVLAMLKIACRR